MAAGDRVLSAIDQGDRTGRTCQRRLPARGVDAAVGEIVEQLVLDPVAAICTDDRPISIQLRRAGRGIAPENLAEICDEAFAVEQADDQPAKGPTRSFWMRRGR